MINSPCSRTTTVIGEKGKRDKKIIDAVQKFGYTHILNNR